MGLFIEHAFRVSEVAGLDIEDFDLEQGTVTIYREKTDETQTHQLKKHTLLAASHYLAECGASSGPLFLGYQGRRITRYGLYDRVRVLGQQVGLPTLSPHDLRHYWTYDALGNATPVDRVQSGGNWKSPTMVLKYARRRRHRERRCDHHGIEGAETMFGKGAEAFPAPSICERDQGVQRLVASTRAVPFLRIGQRGSHRGGRHPRAPLPGLR